MSAIALRSIDTLRGPSTADLVYGELYRRIVGGDLSPGSRISEQEVARQMGSSRQPVRDAFYRLSKLGLVQVQPQRATVVALVSEGAVLQARFVRTALETETARAAAAGLGDKARAELSRLLDAQEAAMAANDRLRFHELDDAFHEAICAASGHAFAWALIRDNKAHMDRVRWLSLAFGAHAAFEDHVRIYEALRDGDPDRAADAMRTHLGRIVDILAQVRSEHPAMFATERT
jgi:DNA-binding GntR family transcriptional regulator